MEKFDIRVSAREISVAVGYVEIEAETEAEARQLAEQWVAQHGLPENAETDDGYIQSVGSVFVDEEFEHSESPDGDLCFPMSTVRTGVFMEGAVMAFRQPTEADGVILCIRQNKELSLAEVVADEIIETSSGLVLEDVIEWFSVTNRDSL